MEGNLEPPIVFSVRIWVVLVIWRPEDAETESIEK
jgi:hypothetical protein